MTDVVPDEAGLRRARFEFLVSDVYGPLQRYLRRRVDPGVVDDVLADTLLVLWRRVDDIPAEAAMAWCYGVARGCLANHRRSQQRRLRLVRRVALEREPEPAGEDPVLSAALAALPDRDQEVLRLWAWEQLPPREIALVLGISANAASIRLHRATQKLKKQLLSGKDQPASGQLVDRQGEEAPR